MEDEKDFDLISNRSSFYHGSQPHSTRYLQAIAHRGLSRKYPENTMISFKAAIEVGAHALETDLHLSKDGVIMLSHDSTLNRCFGINERIIDWNFADLRKLRTLRKPSQRMPTFIELLEFLSLPENQHVWLLLDIKTDNIAEDIIKKIAKALYYVNPDMSFWVDRIQLGVWNIDFVPEYAPEIPITYIGHSTIRAQRFFGVPHASFNLIFPSIVGPFGSSFIKRAKREQRELFVWTLNNKNLMRWAIELGVNGVCTDDPELFLEVSREVKIKGSKLQTPLRASASVWTKSILLPLFALLVRYRLRLRMKEE